MQRVRHHYQKELLHYNLLSNSDVSAYLSLVREFQPRMPECTYYIFVEKLIELRFVAISNHIFRIVVKKSIKMTLINNKY